MNRHNDYDSDYDNTINNRPLYSPVPDYENNNEIIEYNEIIPYNEEININYYKKFNKYFITLSLQRNCIIFIAIANTIIISYLLKFIYI